MAQAEHIRVEIPRSVALFDLSYSFRRHWHAQAPDAEVNDAPRAVLNELATVRRAVDLVIVCLDAPPYWRKQVYPEYKAQREPPSDGMKAAMRWLKERIDKDGYQVASAPTFEADDVMATLAFKLFAMGVQDIRLVGCDKDVTQCVRSGVRQFVPAVGNRPEEIRTNVEVFAKFGVRPDQMAEYQALVGDSSDNIQGILGCGPKTAAKLLAGYGTLAALFEDLESDSDRDFQVPMGEKLIGSLRLGKQQLVEAVKLTTLRTDVPLDVTALLARKEVQKLVEAEDMQDDEDESTFDPIDAREAEPPRATVERHEKQVDEYVARQNAPTPSPPRSAPTPLSSAQALKAVEAEAIVVTPSAPAPSWAMGLQPRSPREAISYAAHFYNARLYSKFGNADAILAVIIRGRELGIGMTTALDSFHVIEGKPSPSADLIRSLAESDPNCEYLMLVSFDSKHATWETKHRKHPRPITYTYTIEDAIKADLVKPSREGKPSNWMRRPQDMLVKTAGSKLARIVYPAATCGLYCPEEGGNEAAEAA